MDFTISKPLFANVTQDGQLTNNTALKLDGIVTEFVEVFQICI